MITKKEGQKIADRLIDILGKNINIMDLSGIVIASTDEERIGTFHEAAKIAVNRRDNIIITKKNIELFRGSREGINLPIIIEDEVVGVVGITGKIEDVKGYGMVVKELVELMITENRVQYEKQLHEDEERNFIIHLINEHSNKNMNFLKSKALLLGFDESVERRLIIGEVKIYTTLKGDKNQGSLITQQNIKKARNIIKKNSKEKVIVVDTYDGKILIVKKDDDNIENYIKKISKEVKDKYNIEIKFIISDICRKFSDYSMEFERCNSVLEINDRSKINNKDIFFTIDYDFKILLQQIPKRQKEQYLAYYKNFFCKIPDKKIDNVIETIKAYCENNMNIGLVSKKLYLHRNTIGYRIKEVEELTGINITNSFECMKIYIAIILYELNQE